jgi:hypothetical protein
MNRREEILQRLLRAAAQTETPGAMPFGFDTRVLARVRETPANGSLFIAALARRVTAISCAVIVLAGAGLYLASVSEINSDATNEYGIVDSAIQNNLGE